MAIVNFALLAAGVPYLVTIVNILIVAIGLGLVIFFHELGHFLVAKWCGVYVERFSIGFGQPVLSRKYGETEYAIGWLPFGGYVKMLGQDDMDPGQMTDEQVAENPRSYSAKPVWQRMAIISAGVIMNVITGMLFFMIAFSCGIPATEPVVGLVQVGMPAWEHGVRSGDVLTEINNRKVQDFNDILRGTALSTGPLTVSGIHPDQTTYTVTMQPEKRGIGRMIGIGPQSGLELPGPVSGEDFPLAYPGTPAASAAFKPGDEVIALGGQPVQSYRELMSYLADHADDSVVFTVRRKGDDNETPTEAKVQVAAERFRSIGLTMSMGKVVSLRKDSLAAKAGIRTGDRIAKVNGLDVEKDLDPFRLTEFFSEHAGEDVTVVLTREVPDSAPVTVTVTVVPSDREPWSEPPMYEASPLSIPSLGLAYELVPTVFSVGPGSAAAQKGIQKHDAVTKVELLPKGDKKDGFGNETAVIDLAKGGWPYAFWMMQEAARTRTVQLTFKPAESDTAKTVQLEPAEVSDWYLPTDRGLHFELLSKMRKANDFAAAISMGWNHTTNSITDIYLTLRGLITRDISHKGLSGPIGIATMAYDMASLGLPYFVLFLGLISVNLAVINFLPIPVLDGGHMVFLLWEGLTRRKPSEKVVATATYAGLIFVLCLMFFVIYQDIFVPKQ